MCHIFAPLPPNESLINQYIYQHLPEWHSLAPEFRLPSGWPAWSREAWDTPPHQLHLRGRFTVWFPPPELARQVITHLLEAFVEAPLTTSGLFFIPRIIPGCWKGLSKCLYELPTVYPHLTPLSPGPFLPIPITVLYLPRHHRSCRPKRVDSPPPPPGAGWHQAQAQEMRGVLGEDSPFRTSTRVPLPDHWVPASWC